MPRSQSNRVTRVRKNWAKHWNVSELVKVDYSCFCWQRSETESCFVGKFEVQRYVLLPVETFRRCYSKRLRKLQEFSLRMIGCDFSTKQIFSVQFSNKRRQNQKKLLQHSIFQRRAKIFTFNKIWLRFQRKHAARTAFSAKTRCSNGTNRTKQWKVSVLRIRNQSDDTFLVQSGFSSKVLRWATTVGVNVKNVQQFRLLIVW
jgi:hypothetical protein